MAAQPTIVVEIPRADTWAPQAIQTETEEEGRRRELAAGGDSSGAEGTGVTSSPNRID
jgi:hypothetical protein